MPARLDLSGQSFDRLVVLERGPNKGKKTRWVCQCSCGNLCLVKTLDLQRKHVRSCGCLQKEVLQTLHRTHGMRDAPEYYIWSHMRDRCQNAAVWNYKNYGGRGIAVCEEWQNSFERFFADMGPRPSPQHSLERIDNNLGYSKANCAWIPKALQQRNTRRNRLITIGSRTECLQEWLHITGIHEATFRNRIRQGLTEEEALTIPPHKGRRLAPIRQAHASLWQIEGRGHFVQGELFPAAQFGP